MWEIPHTAIVTAGKSGGGKVHLTHKEGEFSPTSPPTAAAGTTSTPTPATDNNTNNNSNSNTPHSTHALNPKFISAIDRSHKKCVTDVYWLPPTIQLNHLGRHLLVTIVYTYCKLCSHIFYMNTYTNAHILVDIHLEIYTAIRYHAQHS